MKATFGTTKKGTWAYIQKSVRIDGKSTTKTHLEARPVYLSRQDRIRSHFLVGFLALLLLKLLQKQLADSFPKAYKEHPLAVDQLIDTLQNLRFGQIPWDWDTCPCSSAPTSPTNCKSLPVWKLTNR